MSGVTFDATDLKEILGAVKAGLSEPRVSTTPVIPTEIVNELVPLLRMARTMLSAEVESVEHRISSEMSKKADRVDIEHSILSKERAEFNLRKVRAAELELKLKERCSMMSKLVEETLECIRCLIKTEGAVDSLHDHLSDLAEIRSELMKVKGFSWT